MNESKIDRIRRVLVRTAKRQPELDTAKAELGFDTRLLAAIRERKADDESPWALWDRLVWRAVPVVAALAVVLACIEVPGPAGDESWLSWGDPLGLELALVEQVGGL